MVFAMTLASFLAGTRIVKCGSLPVFVLRQNVDWHPVFAKPLAIDRDVMCTLKARIKPIKNIAAMTKYPAVRDDGSAGLKVLVFIFLTIALLVAAWSIARSE
jgi:hypothetical protein